MSGDTESTNAKIISADEIALYDRQIRLWGMKAQERIRNANILLVTMKGLGNEIAKNLTLAGIASLTLHDNMPVTEDDLCAQFFLTEADKGRFRATAAATPLQKLNPRVMIHVETRDIFTLSETFFEGFDIIIATDLHISALNTLNAMARMCKKPFYAAGSHGLYGYVFADLISHDYVITRAKSNMTTKLGDESATRSIISTSSEVQNGKEVEIVKKRESYQPLILANTSPLPESYLSSRRRLKNVTPLLPCQRALWEFEKQIVPPRLFLSSNPDDLALFTTLATQKAHELSLPPTSLTADFLRSFLANLYSELSPVCAFLGAQLSQDVINVLGQREQPIQNMLLFDGEQTRGEVYALMPFFAAGPTETKAKSPSVLDVGRGGTETVPLLSV